MEGAEAAPGLESTLFEWEDGYARVEAARAHPGRQRALGRIVTAIHDELRKRLGSRFTVRELAALYREQGDSLLDLAMAAVPAGESLDDTSAARDAAFDLYMREAADFAGGGVIPRSPPPQVRQERRRGGS
jgi:hypothetical protein